MDQLPHELLAYVYVPCMAGKLSRSGMHGTNQNQLFSDKDSLVPSLQLASEFDTAN
jgi:hypothetical protein